MTTCSVLLCTYNRAALLRTALQALVCETTEKPDQVVVVNGGNDETDRVVESFQGVSAVEVRLVKTVNKNLAASRNIGLAHCTGDLIAMTDDDARVFPDWISQIKRAHAEHPEAGAVGGTVLGTNTDTLVGKLSDLVTFPAWPTPRYVRTLPGVNISYKSEVVQRLGPQDETLFRGEDVDYNWRLQRLGYKVYFDPALQVHHYHRATLRGFFHQHFMYGRAYYLVRRKWPEMYCVYPHALRGPRDVLKALNLIAAIVYEPLLSARRLEHVTDRVQAYPILVANQIAWRAGMIRQAISDFQF